MKVVWLKYGITKYIEQGRDENLRNYNVSK